jgi:hypothetical protein
MNINRKTLYAAVAVAMGSVSVSSFAALPSYVTAAITDSQAQLTELVSTMVPAAIALVLLALTPRVLLKMIRALGSKVSF